MNTGQTVVEDEGNKPVTTKEGVGTNERDSFGECDGCESSAASECTFTNGIDIERENQGRKSAAVIEREFVNSA